MITRERANRKTLFQEIGKANSDLKALVEKEKKLLSDKVAEEMERHLQQAVKEKMASDEALVKARRDLEEKTKEVEVLSRQNQQLQEDLRGAQQTDAEMRSKVQSLEEEGKAVKVERDTHKASSEENKATVAKMEAD